MSLVLPILLCILSVFFIFQGSCSRGYLPVNALILDKFASNNTFLLIRAVLLKYSIVLGVLGIALSVFLFICHRSSNLELKMLKSFWVLLVVYILFAIFIIV